MAYPPRQFHSGYWYHVFTHHQRDGVLFHSDEDRRQFLQYLDQTLSRQKAFLGAFCLMDTHYHSLIRMGEVDLGRIFQTVHMRYAQYFNQTHDEQGNLFHRRPGMKIVLNDDYLYSLSHTSIRIPSWRGWSINLRIIPGIRTVVIGERSLSTIGPPGNSLQDSPVRTAYEFIGSA